MRRTRGSRVSLGGVQMISQLRIKNFKPIRDLSLDCRRVNVLIGDPNTGKSNILESGDSFVLSLRVGLPRCKGLRQVRKHGQLVL